MEPYHVYMIIGSMMLVFLVAIISFFYLQYKAGKNKTVAHDASRSHDAAHGLDLTDTSDKWGHSITMYKTKVFVVMFQIFVSLTWVFHRMEWPPSFQKFLNLFTIFNFDVFDVLPLGCIYEADQTSKILASTMLPVILCAIILVPVNLMRLLRVPLPLEIGDHAFMAAIFLIYCVFPTVSLSIFKNLPCYTFEDGESFMEADFSINCDTDKYKFIQEYAYIMIFVYPIGVPLLMFSILVRHRKRISMYQGLRVEIAHGIKDTLAVKHYGEKMTAYKNRQQSKEKKKLAKLAKTRSRLDHKFHKGESQDLLKERFAQQQEAGLKEFETRMEVERVDSIRLYSRTMRDKLRKRAYMEMSIIEQLLPKKYRNGSLVRSDRDEQPCHNCGLTHPKMPIDVRMSYNRLQHISDIIDLDVVFCHIRQVHYTTELLDDLEKLQNDFKFQVLQFNVLSDSVVEGKFGAEQASAYHSFHARDDIKPVRFGTSLAKYSMLFQDFSVWWWETLETSRRMMLTGFLYFVDGGSAFQILVAILVQLGVLKVFQAYKPCLKRTDNLITEGAHWVLAIVCLMALMMRIDTTQRNPFFDAVLIMIALLVPAAVFSTCYGFLRDRIWKTEGADGDETHEKWVNNEGKRRGSKGRRGSVGLMIDAVSRRLKNTPEPSDERALAPKASSSSDYASSNDVFDGMHGSLFASDVNSNDGLEMQDRNFNANDAPVFGNPSRTLSNEAQAILEDTDGEEGIDQTFKSVTTFGKRGAPRHEAPRSSGHPDMVEDVDL